MSLRRFLSEPLLHFMLLGGLLFVLYDWVNAGVPSAPTGIVVDQARLSSLEAQFRRVWQRPPTPQELQGLLDTWVKEEIFYREGMAMGLDQDDPIVRRRIAQKMEFLADGQVPAAPSDEELQAWLDSHADKYRSEPRYSLSQVYFDPSRHGEGLGAAMSQARAALAQGRDESLGDSSMLPGSLQDASATEVARAFGSEFAEALATLPLADWQGPLRSGYGLHLVRLGTRQAARVPALAEVRSAVERDLLSARSAEAGERFYQSLRQRYSVRLESGPVAEVTPVVAGAQ